MRGQTGWGDEGAQPMQKMAQRGASALCTRCKMRPMHRRWPDGTGLCGDCWAAEPVKPRKTNPQISQIPQIQDEDRTENEDPSLRRGEEVAREEEGGAVAARREERSPTLAELVRRRQEADARRLNAEESVREDLRAMNANGGQRKRLDEATVAAIRDAYRTSALRVAEIAEKFGTTEATVYARCAGVKRKNPPVIVRSGRPRGTARADEAGRKEVATKGGNPQISQIPQIQKARAIVPRESAAPVAVLAIGGFILQLEGHAEKVQRAIAALKDLEGRG